MPDVRPMNEKKYGISKHKFLQAYHFCMQYNEWRDELKHLKITVKSIDYSKERKGSATGSATEQIAIKRAELQRKCELVEQTAIEADAEIYEYILKGATTEYATYKYLKEVMNIPCGKNMYYERRRKFYWLLSKKI